MKKNGFTLAEVLVVLGIIGVVAALTLPSLMSDTAAAQIGPKLAKAVSMFDQANASLLVNVGSDNLLDSGLLDDGDYLSKLTDHLKSAIGGNIDTTNVTSGCNKLIGGQSIGAITAKDGTVYQIYYNSAATPNGGAAHKDKIGFVVVDINGAAMPNAVGTDIFAFSWWGDGSLKPAGGSNADAGCVWKDATNHCRGKALTSDGSDEGVSNYWACAGHVFENDFKVKYE